MSYAPNRGDAVWIRLNPQARQGGDPRLSFHHHRITVGLDWRFSVRSQIKPKGIRLRFRFLMVWMLLALCCRIR